MNVFDPKELLSYVREKSPYYRELYKQFDLDTSLADLPVTSQEEFWKSNTFKDNKVLTSTLRDGVVFKSGGTTGNPKFSFFTKDEWEQFTSDFGFGMDQLRMKEGDLCANLFYSGDLYASFLFINKSVEKMKTKVTQFPITGQTDVEETLKIISDYKVNVLFGVPTSLINMAAQSGTTIEHVDQIYYGGEPLFNDQKEMILKTFPNAYISSIGYASVDGGQLGYVDGSCSLGEHRVFKSTIMEIVDPDSGEIINEVGRTGKLVFTNLTRKLMPIIKYPVGDLARWIDVGEKFKLLGRSDEGARIGPVTVNRDDISKVLTNLNLDHLVDNFQLYIRRKKSKDYLDLILGSSNEADLNQCLKKLDFEQEFYSERHMYKKEYDEGLIERFLFRVVNTDKLVKNPRTGKLRLVIDERHN